MRLKERDSEAVTARELAPREHRATYPYGTIDYGSEWGRPVLVIRYTGREDVVWESMRRFTSQARADRFINQLLGKPVYAPSPGAMYRLMAGEHEGMGVVVLGNEGKYAIVRQHDECVNLIGEPFRVRWTSIGPCVGSYFGKLE